MKQDKYKKLRITWNGEPLREIYPYASRWEVIKYRTRRFFYRVFIVTMAVFAFAAVLSVTFFIGKSYADEKVITLSPSDIAYPVLDRIAKCESGGSHYSASGQVLMHWNENKTVDVGKYAINSKWFKKASELGLDLTKESDNKAMALWIYQNRGTEDWYPSKACWQK